VEAADSGEDCWVTELTSSLASEADDSSLDLSGATGDCHGTLKNLKCFESSEESQESSVFLPPLSPLQVDLALAPLRQTLLAVTTVP
jgi:hypothetical protein